MEGGDAGSNEITKNETMKTEARTRLEEDGAENDTTQQQLVELNVFVSREGESESGTLTEAEDVPLTRTVEVGLHFLCVFQKK